MGRIWREVLALAAAGAAASACAPAPMVHEAERVLVYDDAGNALRTTNPGPDRPVQLDAAAPLVIEVVTAVYRKFGVPVGLVDGHPGRIGHTAFVVPRRFLGLDNSQLFECGSGVTGPIADRSRIEMFTVTEVRAAGTKAMLTTTLRAIARPFEGTSTATQNCGSTGRFEQKLLEDVRIALQIRATQPP